MVLRSYDDPKALHLELSPLELVLNITEEFPY